MKRFALIATVAAFYAFAAGAQAEEDATFKAIDANSDGFVTESEFVAHQTASGEVSSTAALVTFIGIDKDASGTISIEEMKAAMESSGDEGEDEGQPPAEDSDPMADDTASDDGA